MDSSTSIQLIFLLLLLCLSAFFSSAETALTTVNRHKIRAFKDDGDKRADIVLKLIDNPGKLLSTILIGNNIVNLSASSLATSIAIKLLGSVGAGIATGILTFLILIFGEITPKTYATLNSESMSLSIAKVIYLLTIILTPVIAIVNTLSKGLLFLLRIDPEQSNNIMTEREFLTIVDVSHEEGVIEEEEKDMINNVVDFGDSFARDIMIPRIDATVVPVTIGLDELKETFAECLFSRIPVYEDEKEHIVGIIYLRDLYMYEMKDLGKDAFDIRKVMREPFFTYEMRKTSALLATMRKNSVSFAIILDEYGSMSGLVTLEDLLEEIVGEIRDEYDEEEMLSLVQVGERDYQVDGAMKLDDLNDYLKLDITSEDFDSVGGKIIELLDKLPKKGSVAECDQCIFHVISMDKHRVDRVQITLK